MGPKISIIVPVHNLELYLNDCVESILNQTFTDFEVLLVNDGSTDRSSTICDDLAKADKRVKVIHKAYGGVSSARNVGVRMAQGTYIGFVDGDDRIDENMYQKLFGLCRSTNSDIAICKLGREINGELINKNNTAIYQKELDHLEGMRELFKGLLYRFSLCNKLFHKKCFKDIKFPEGRIHEDLATTYKLFANANKSVFTNYIGYVYVKRENSILTSRFNHKRLDAFVGWEEILAFMSKQYKHLSQVVFASFGYWCIDNVYYILNQVEIKVDRDIYLGKIQRCVRQHYKEIMKNNSLSLMYKYLVTLLNCNIRLLLFTHSMKRMFSRIG